MINLNKTSEQSRVAWLVLCDERYLFLTRSGSGAKYLGDKYKKADFRPAMIRLSLFNKLKNSIAFITDKKENRQVKLFDNN